MTDAPTYPILPILDCYKYSNLITLATKEVYNRSPPYTLHGA